VFAVRCIAESDAERRTNFASAKAMCLATLSVVTNDVAVVCAASIAWMIGDALARHYENDSPLMNVSRWLAAAIWLGIPLTAGFVGRVGVVSQLAQRGWAGVVVLLLSLLALGIGVSALLGGESRGHIRSALIDRHNRRFIGSLSVLAFAAILFGAFTTLYANTTLTQMLSRDITLNGSAFLVSVALSVAFWRAAPRLQDRLRPALDRASRALAFEEWGDAVAGAFARMGSPFRHVFTFFEADGTVIWAIIVVMLFILTTRGITP
jgi:NADH:ubiquinone oxidoreductase subunit 2 (subunit N)